MTPRFPKYLLAAFALLAGALSATADVFFVPDSTGGVVTRVSTGGKSSVNTPGVTAPEQVVFDPLGNLYVADGGTGTVIQFPSGGGAPVPVGDAVPGITSLAFDGAGVLHVALSGDRTIRKLDGNAFAILTTLPTGASPQSLAFAPDGNLFAADSAGSRIYQITPAGLATLFSSDVTSPFAVAFNSAGKLHATDTQQGGRILSFTGNGNNPGNNAKPEVTSLGSIRGLAFDAAGTAFFLTSTGELRKVAGNNSTLVVGTLGNARQLTARAPLTEVVAFRGQTLTNPNGGRFSTLGSPAIGGDAVAFKGTLLAGVAGVSAANSAGLWYHDAGGLALLARKSFPPPSLPTDTLLLFGDPVLNGNGKIAFIGTMRAGFGTTTAANSTALFSDVAGALGPILRKGDLAPGLGVGSNAKFVAFSKLVLPDDAGPAVLATIAGTGINAANNLGLWSADATGAFSLVVRKGDPVQVGGKTRKIAALTLFTPTPLSLGHGRQNGANRQFTFAARFTDGFTAILGVEPGMAPVVRAEKSGAVGNALPGAVFLGFGAACTSEQANRFSFVGKLVPNFGGVTAASAFAIFEQAAGVNGLVAQRTFGAPGINGAVFATISDPVQSPSGSLAFFARMKVGLGGVLVTNSAGLWSDTGSGLRLEARQGDVAPGVAGGAKFTVFRQFVLPDTGGVVFTATVAGTGITAANNFGLWAGDGAGGLELLLRKGAKMKIGGLTRTVTVINVFKTVVGVTGQSRQFDSDGNVCCQVICSDGTQAILTFRRP